MNPTEFREAVEKWGRENKIPLRQVMEVIEDVGQKSLIERAEQGEAHQHRFLYANYHMLRLSRMRPEDAIRESHLVPHPDELNKKVEVLDQ